jgi:uncharacterized membrane protein HdeD (DUF308 family)
MLHDLFGIALICMGALTMVARVMARSTEFHRRPSQQSLPHPSHDPRY